MAAGRQRAVTYASRRAVVAVALAAIACGRSDRRAATPMADPALPGIAAPDPRLSNELATALAAKGADYRPRTRHLRADGSPRFTNRLIRESSPYLLQHAHNPVNWFAWGDEAFARARAQHRPVLLSIGYSTCHWCHVMERESFEDETIAAYLNQHFVAIKVDREERPDVDDLYMEAVQAMTGRGGWPMTVFLTADRKPFFGATYFPRDQFLSVLQQIDRIHATDPSTVAADAARAVADLAPKDGWMRGDVPGPEALERAARLFARTFDRTWGGFGGAPKFPRPAALDFLLRYHRRTGDAFALEMVTRTLERMAAGGMHDHVGGGFHRYSVDERWFAPHFEKMLYDQAQLACIYLDAYQVTGREDFARVAERTLDYVLREMTSADGAFYSATDADSRAPSGEEEEGYYFTWTAAELTQALGPQMTPTITAYFGVTPSGNFEGRNILYAPQPASAVAASLGRPVADVIADLETARELLRAARDRRPRPHLDDKIVASWNGLMISAFARGAMILDRPAYASAATRAAEFVLSRMRDRDRRLLRSFREGRARHLGVLEDHAFVIQGLLDLQEATGDLRWLDEAVALQRAQDSRFAAPDGGYFGTPADGEKLLARTRPLYDGAEPSGNSVAAANLLRLAELTGDDAWRERARRILAAFAGRLAQGDVGSPRLLSALEQALDRPLEIALVAPSAVEELGPLQAAVRRRYVPNRALVITVGPAGVGDARKRVPWVEGKEALGGRPTAFVCERTVCKRPTSDPDELARQLAEASPLFADRSPAPLP